MKELLTGAMHEITDLRRRNEILSAQMAIIDVFAAALGLRRNEGAMAPDIVWELRKKIEELSAPQI